MWLSRKRFNELLARMQNLEYDLKYACRDVDGLRERHYALLRVLGLLERKPAPQNPFEYVKKKVKNR